MNQQPQPHGASDLHHSKGRYRRSSDLVRNMRNTIGEGWKDREKLRAISPVSMAEWFNAPVLLIHRRDDTVVPISQSKDMAKALLAKGKSVRLIELDGEDHWLSIASTREKMLEASGNFLMEHLGPTD